MKTALVVDDTKNIRLLLSQCLSNEGFKVSTACNASEALDLLDHSDFDIAFIDIKMPNMSGTALLENIRKNNHNFPVVIMTAFGTIKNAVTTTKLGAIAYLQKPFTANTIRKTLLEIIPNFQCNSNVQVDPYQNIKLNLRDNPLLPDTYNELGDLLISLGDTEKGILFKDLSVNLNKLK